MEPLPLFISLITLVVWAGACLFIPPKMRLTTQATGFAMSLAQLGSAIWATVLTFSEGPRVAWNGTWLATSAPLEINFFVEPLTAIFWLALSLALFVFAYLALAEQMGSQGRGSRSFFSGEAVSLPILGSGALVSLTSANILVFYFGWALVSFAGFLTVAFSAPTRNERARASFRYVILSAFAECVFFCGILGAYSALNSLSFTDINQRAFSIPPWALICLVLGAMLRNFQIPLKRSAKYLADAKNSALPVLFIGHSVLASVLFFKMYPAILSSELIQYLAIIPALTTLVAALLILPERDPVMVIGWATSYLSGAVFLSGISGMYQATHALSLTGTVALLLLALSLVAFQSGEKLARWFISIAVISLVGLPIMGFGWARYIEYLGLLNQGLNLQENPMLSMQWIYFSLKVIGDFILALALWGILRDAWRQPETESKPDWGLIVVMGILALGCFAILIGGRPFGGMMGSLYQELTPSLAWFERFITAPMLSSSAVLPRGNAVDLLGGQADVMCRGIVLGLLILPALLAVLWLFRETAASEKTRVSWSSFLEKTYLKRDSHSILWDGMLKPVSRAIGKGASLFDQRLLDYAFSDLWLRPARFARRIFSSFESGFIDRKLVDGVGLAVGSVSKALRLVQNGQVQFYLAIGLILMAVIVTKFIVMGRV